MMSGGDDGISTLSQDRFLILMSLPSRLIGLEPELMSLPICHVVVDDGPATILNQRSLRRVGIFFFLASLSLRCVIPTHIWDGGFVDRQGRHL